MGILSKAKHEAAGAANEAGSMIDTVGGKAREGWAATADKVADAITEFSGKTTELAARGRDKALSAAGSATTYVKENPWKSLAVGAAALLAAGYAAKKYRATH